MNAFSAWFLVLLLSTPDPEVTYMVAIEQPDKQTCLEQLNKYVYVESLKDDVPTEQTLVDKICREGSA